MCNVVFSHFFGATVVLQTCRLVESYGTQTISSTCFVYIQLCHKFSSSNLEFHESSKAFNEYRFYRQFLFGNELLRSAAWSLVNLCSFTSLDIIRDIVIYGVP